MRSIRSRLARLEKWQPPEPRIRWENLLVRRREDIVPDGVIDWYGLWYGEPVPDLIEEEIARVRRER